MRWSKTYIEISPSTYRPWFAWYPVKVQATKIQLGDGIIGYKNRWVWLEWVERNGWLIKHYRLPDTGYHKEGA